MKLKAGNLKLATLPIQNFLIKLWMRPTCTLHTYLFTLNNLNSYVIFYVQQLCTKFVNLRQLIFNISPSQLKLHLPFKYMYKQNIIKTKFPYKIKYCYKESNIVLISQFIFLNLKYTLLKIHKLLRERCLKEM